MMNGNGKADDRSDGGLLQIPELYELGKRKTEEKISRSEKFLKHIQEINRERESLRQKPKGRFWRFLVLFFIVGLGIFIMFMPERSIVGRSIFDFSPPPSLYIELGRFSVINFFASWCEPCKDEIPELIKFSREHQDISVIGVAVNDEKEKLDNFIRGLGVSYPVVMDDGKFSKKLGISSIPQTIIVGSDARIMKVIYGPLSSKKLESYVIELIKNSKK